MPDSLPDDRHLLASAIAYMEDELLPTLTGYHRFQTRVTINALGIVLREIEQGGRADAAEAERLRGLLEKPGTREALNAQLAAEIRDGSRDITDPALIAHVERTLDAALAINNPKWLRR